MDTALVLTWALAWPRSVKRLVVVTLDMGLGLLAMWLAFSLRLDTLHWPEGMQWAVYLLGPAMALPVFARMGLYRAIFRYSGIAALLATGRAVATYGALLLALLLLAHWEGVPRSVGILQPLILLLLIGASRAALGWLWLSGQAHNAPHRLLIYGAGTAGALTAAGLAGARQYALRGFVDDDPAKTGSSINGARVHSPHGLAALIQRESITEVLLALPSVSHERRRNIIENLSQWPVRIRTLPSLADLASGRVSVTDFQDLDVIDLLGRTPVAPDAELLARNLRGAVVLVTGAGGSIGSELCRQILRVHPSKLLLVDHSEYALYNIHQELQAMVHAQQGGACTLVPVLASVTDETHMARICREHRPGSIYHAAAYKHVPMVEANAAEGVLNNVFGTLSVVRAAMAHGARHFVLVSTDKAVRPTNVMGASKRVAELVLQAISTSAQPGPTRFSMVRFGNVLGSSGSVIPLFRRQIAAGGPVTVTHPEVTRYFMTIPEAAQLVLQAGAMAESGDLFLLDMGEPIRIVDLARRMVALSGLTVRNAQHPGGDIEIQFIGLRPGEKLYEELLIGDNPMPTAHPRILRAREEHMALDTMQPLLEALRSAALADESSRIKALLHQLVPGYQTTRP